MEAGQTARARPGSAPAYINGYVVVGDYQGYLHWLSAGDGRFVTRYRVGSDAVTARAIPGAQALTC